MSNLSDEEVRKVLTVSNNNSPVTGVPWGKSYIFSTLKYPSKGKAKQKEKVSIDPAWNLSGGLLTL